MVAITVANKDWSIIEDVKAALAAATIGGAAAFSAVTAGTSDAQADECQFKAHPAAIVRYLGTSQSETPEGHMACAVSLEIVLATKVATDGTDESPRLGEMLRLVSAAANAIGAAKPADSCAWGTGGQTVRRLAFGQPRIEIAPAAPWIVARLPLTVGYVLESETSH